VCVTRSPHRQVRLVFARQGDSAAQLEARVGSAAPTLLFSAAAHTAAMTSSANTGAAQAALSAAAGAEYTQSAEDEELQLELELVRELACARA
jgi:hypothetical protein